MKAFHFKGRKKGARQIKMTLEGQFKVVFNLKRIRRIMKKYAIICPIRKTNPYKRMMKATQEHKDEAYIKPCQTLDELKREIKEYMTYYNQYRYQWDLKKMTPVQYRDHLLKLA